MNREANGSIRLLAGLMLVLVAAPSTGAARSAVNACTEAQWAIAMCGFMEDCGEEFLPEFYGCGVADVCAYDPVNDFVYYEGMCFPQETPCTQNFC